jgi:hypothetical protein
MATKPTDLLAQFEKALQRFSDVTLLLPVNDGQRQVLWQRSRKVSFLLTRSLTVAAEKGLKSADVAVLGKLAERVDVLLDHIETTLFLASGAGGRRFSERELFEALRALERNALYKLAEIDLGMVRRKLSPELLALPRAAARGAGDVLDELKQLLKETKALLVIVAAVLLLIDPEIAIELLAMIAELEIMDEILEGGGDQALGGGIVVPVPGGGAACNYVGSFVTLQARGNHQVANNLAIFELFDGQQTLLMRSGFQVPPTGNGNVWVPVGIGERQIIQSTVPDGCGKEGIFAVYGKLTVELDQPGQTRTGNTGTAFLGNNKVCSPQGFEDRQEVRASVDVTQGGTAGTVEFKVTLKLTGKCAR